MNIEDHLIRYPNMDSGFYDTLVQLDEFREGAHTIKKRDRKMTDKDDPRLNRDVYLEYHQQLLQRYMSPGTFYDRMFIYGLPGTGKTCQMLAVVVHARDTLPNLYFNKTLVIIERSQVDSFKLNLIKCVPRYRPVPIDIIMEENTYYQKKQERGEDISRLEKQVWNRSAIDNDFEFIGHTEFINHCRNIDTSNRIIIVDEVHMFITVDAEGKNDPTRYNTLHDFLHKGKSNIILIATGTPGVTDVEDVTKIINLALPLDKQLDGVDDPNFNEKCRGYISFINKKQDKNRRLIVEGTKLKIGKTNLGQIIHTSENNIDSRYKFSNVEQSTVIDSKLTLLKPSETQLQDIINTTTMERNAFRTKERFATIKPTDPSVFYRALSEAKSEDNRRNGKKLTFDISEYKKRLEVLEMYSIKIWFYVKGLLESFKTGRKSFLYSNFVAETLNFIAKVLTDYFGFEQVKTSKTDVTEERPRFILVTGSQDTTPTNLFMDEGKKDANIELISKFTDANNWDGRRILTVLGSRVTSVSVSFYDTLDVYILDPSANESETEQIVNRIDRFNGLSVYIKNKYGGLPYTDVIDQKIYKLAIDTENSVDIYFYYNAQYVYQKRIAPYLYNTIKIAYDCPFMHKYNIWDPSYDGSPECLYNKCNYDCADVNMSLINNPIEIDYRNLRAIYTPYITSLLQPKLEMLFKKHQHPLSIDQLFSMTMDINKDITILVSALFYMIDKKIFILNNWGIPSILTNQGNMFYLSSHFGKNLIESSIYDYNIITNNSFDLGTYLNNNITVEPRGDIVQNISEVTNIQDEDMLLLKLNNIGAVTMAQYVEYVMSNANNNTGAQFTQFTQKTNFSVFSIPDMVNGSPRLVHNILGSTSFRIYEKDNNVWRDIEKKTKEYDHYNDYIKINFFIKQLGDWYDKDYRVVGTTFIFDNEEKITNRMDLGFVLSILNMKPSGGNKKAIPRGITNFASTSQAKIVSCYLILNTKFLLNEIQTAFGKTFDNITITLSEESIKRLDDVLNKDDKNELCKKVYKENYNKYKDDNDDDAKTRLLYCNVLLNSILTTNQLWNICKGIIIKKNLIYKTCHKPI